MFNFLVCREDKELAEIFYERGGGILFKSLILISICVVLKVISNIVLFVPVNQVVFVFSTEVKDMGRYLKLKSQKFLTVDQISKGQLINFIELMSSYLFIRCYFR